MFGCKRFRVLFCNSLETDEKDKELCVKVYEDSEEMYFSTRIMDINEENSCVI